MDQVKASALRRKRSYKTNHEDLFLEMLKPFSSFAFSCTITVFIFDFIRDSLNSLALGPFQKSSSSKLYSNAFLLEEHTQDYHITVPFSSLYLNEHLSFIHRQKMSSRHFYLNGLLEGFFREIRTLEKRGIA